MANTENNKKKLLLVVIAALLATLAVVIFWGLLVHWTNYNIVVMPLVIGAITGLFVRMAVQSYRPMYVVIGVIISLWGIYLGYSVATVVFAADHLHHGYWSTFKTIGFAHLNAITISNLGVFDIIFSAFALVTAGALSSRKI